MRWFIFAGMAIALALWCWSDRRDRPAAWDFKHVNEWANYIFNNWGPVVLAPVGLIAVFAAVRQLTRKLQADDDGITYGQESLRWGEVRKIDAARLKSKGILVLRTADGGKLTLDSWKLANFKELVAFVEKKLPQAERIEPAD